MTETLARMGAGALGGGGSALAVMIFVIIVIDIVSGRSPTGFVGTAFFVARLYLILLGIVMIILAVFINKKYLRNNNDNKNINSSQIFGTTI